MLPYIVNRLGTQLLPVLFLASILVFMSVRLIPGDPAAAAVGENATPEAYFAYREQLGLNDPWYEQYFNWIGGSSSATSASRPRARRRRTSSGAPSRRRSS